MLWDRLHSEEQLACEMMAVRRRVLPSAGRHAAWHTPRLSCAAYGIRQFSSRAPMAGSHAALTELDVQHFSSIVGASNMVTDEDGLAAYNTDWMGQYRGSSRLALRPASTEQVSRILEHCNRQRIAVVPQGGNTGLVGGSVPLADEVVLSLSRMQSVLSLDEYSGHLVCEAGCVLETLQTHVMERGYTMPIDLGGECQTQTKARPCSLELRHRSSSRARVQPKARARLGAIWLPTLAGCATFGMARCMAVCSGWRLRWRTARCSTR